MLALDKSVSTWTMTMLL